MFFIKSQSIGTEARACPRTSRRCAEKEKSKTKKALLKSRQSRAWKPQPVAAWNLASASMESMPIALYGIKTEGRGDTRQAAMPYAGGRFHAIRKAN